MIRPLLVAALLFSTAACSGGDGTSCICIPDRDAGPQPDAVKDPPCDLVTQVGCRADEKCGVVIESLDFGLVRTDCIPDGTVPAGGACSASQPIGGGHYDDCAASLHCYEGTCAELCDRGERGCPGGACIWAHISGTMFGSGLLPAAVCVPVCDPFQQDCDGGRICYLDVFELAGACMAPFRDSDLPRQDEPALVPSSMVPNGCAPGYAPLAPESPEGSSAPLCAFVCTPSETEPGGDPAGTPCSFVSDELPSGPGEGYDCRFINSFVDGADDVPPQFGICVDPVVWGSCVDNTGDPDTDTPGCQPR
jgi:hypothetical protein